MEELIEKRLKSALSEYFGFDAFKDNQEYIIKNIILQNDTLVIMPTGGGKSLCYQLPAIISEGTAIIISPLIALMKNQVDLVRGYSSQDNIAHFLNSSLNRHEIRQVKQDLVDGHTKMLYVAPETLTKPETIAFFSQLKISFIAIDEAHCISEWGHDFRPEYRRIRQMVDGIKSDLPIMALTATATPKVRDDIIKILQMKEPTIYASSFNRPNLYYEIRPKGKKDEVMSQIIRFIKTKEGGKSGIIYCLNRKTTEEIAASLQANDIKAVAYHAGLDADLRAQRQDQFLSEDVSVIVATIAFGMGIDKPDVRFVIHFNMPKSIENYYQETGRAGRDGLEGRCIGFFNHTDMTKLEKFMRDKPVAEREIGGQHLSEIVGYCETAACRRKFLLHYFGEEYPSKNCNCGCDNCANPKEKIEASQDIILTLKTIIALDELFDKKYLIKFLTGNADDTHNIRPEAMALYAKGQDKNDAHWSSIITHALLHNLLKKDVEHYGVLKLTNEGRNYINQPFSIEIAQNHQYDEIAINYAEINNEKTGVIDEPLQKILESIRRRVAKQKALPPYVIFQERSLEEMATYYPITNEELEKITGVSKGKVLKYGKEFLTAIAKYVEENDITRPDDFVVKTVATKSKDKVYIIQNIDKKIPIQSIAAYLDLNFEDILTEIEKIVDSGTRLNINYHLDAILDQEQQNEIIEYYMNSETDDIKLAFQETKGEYSEEDLRLMRIKFMSEIGH